MGLLESITHSEEIKELLEEAQRLYDNANKKFEEQKIVTTKDLEELGKVKVFAWAEGMESFVGVFSSFNNIEIEKVIDTNTKFIGYDEEPEQMIINIQNATYTANEIAKAGFAAVGTGALIGIASYGGAMMFAKASTGTAIAALTGAAKTNATLAWFGGGSKAIGGLGVAGGKLILAGIVVAPIVAVAAVIAGAKGKEKLAEAKKVNAEVKESVQKINIMITGMEGISTMSDNYSVFIKKFGKKFQPFIKELERIKSRYSLEENEMIDFDSLSKTEQKTLHITWLMAQIYYQVLSTPIMTADGKVSEEAEKIINASERGLLEIRRETFKMSNEYAPVADIFWKPEANKMLIVNFIAVGVYLAMSFFVFRTKIVKGILVILCSVIAFPIFFKYKELAANKLYMWRLIRLILSIISVITVMMIL